jgi:GT2 family glycosyltransferase
LEAAVISIIICSINPVSYTRLCARYRELLGNEPHEFIGIHDARGLSEAYNRGLAQSRGEVVIFSHDDIEIWTPEFLPRLKKHLQEFDIVGVAGTSKLISPGWHAVGPPYTFGQITHPVRNEYSVSFYGGQGHTRIGGIQAMDGLFLAFRREAILRVGWDQQHFTAFHCYDIDCTYRASRMGCKLGVALDLPMFHNSGGNFNDEWKVHAHIFLQRHGATLATSSRLGLQAAIVQVPTRQDALALMTAYCQAPA